MQGDNMIKVKAMETFGFARINEITNLKRARREVPETICVDDTFECSREIYDYLNGNNAYHKKVVKIIEYKP